MHAIKIAVLLLILLTVSGCGQIASPGDLLHAPNLAGEEQSLYRSVQPFLPSGYQLTTPDQSDQGSAIRLADLNGDGEKELIVSYKKPDIDYEVNVLILSRQNGSWQKADLITGSGTNLDYLGIKPLIHSSSAELLLGYEGGGYGLPKELYIYSFANQKAVELLHRSYDQIAVGDLAGNGLNQIAIALPAAEPNDSPSQIEVLGEKSGKLAVLAERRTEGDVLNLQIERASEQRIGLFAQVLGTKRSGYTVLLAWENGRLGNVLSLPQSIYDKRSSRQNLKLDEPDYNPDLAVTEQKWWIDYPANNRDIDNDGITEVALPNPLPNTDEPTAQPQTWSDSYYRWDGNREMTFVEDRFWQWGYELRIPDRWLGHYRIELPKADDTTVSEVLFVYSPHEDPEGGSSALLLTLRQLSMEEWNRLRPLLENQQNEYVVLGSTGPAAPGSSSEVTVALLPDTDNNLTGAEAAEYEKLRLTADEVREMVGADTDEEEEANHNVEKH